MAVVVTALLLVRVVGISIIVATEFRLVVLYIKDLKARLRLIIVAIGSLWMSSSLLVWVSSIISVRAVIIVSLILVVLIIRVGVAAGSRVGGVALVAVATIIILVVWATRHVVVCMKSTTLSSSVSNRSPFSQLRQPRASPTPQLLRAHKSTVGSKTYT